MLDCLFAERMSEVNIIINLNGLTLKIYNQFFLIKGVAPVI